MELGDLKIGDWVYNQDNIPVKIDKINGRLYNIEGITINGIEECIHISDISPIQIIPEILKKNGFILESCGYCWYQEQGIDFQNYILVTFRKNGEPRTVEMNFINKVKAEYKDIFFIHQLQHAIRRVGKEIIL